MGIIYHRFHCWNVPRGPDPEIEREAILREFVMSPDPAFTAGEIANKLDVSGEGARHQMNNLVDSGYLDRKKPGQRTVLYWITPKGEQHYYEHADSS